VDVVRAADRRARKFDEISDDEFLDALCSKHRLNPVGSEAKPSLARPDSGHQNGRVGQTRPIRQLSLATTDVADGDYRPVDSVWYGEEDAELIERLLTFYPHREPDTILDATVNGGRFWRGTRRKVFGLDIDPRHRPNVCADNAAMPFGAETFDVVVYDPPHIPNQGHDKTKDFNLRFGLGARSSKENGYTFSHTFPPFMAEAWRVLVPDGILLCKIVDYVHNHRYQWAHIDLIHAGQAQGFTACDCIIKVRKAPIVDPKWRIAHHSRRQHCYWLVFRKSHRCE
jgi:SAM-dependent methyltransferase